MTSPLVPLRLVVQKPHQDPILLEARKIREEIAEAAGFKGYLERTQRWAKNALGATK
jgi:hypothetical protein